jgi:hypothetical protein
VIRQNAGVASALPERTRLLDVVASLDAVERRGRRGVFPTIFAQTPWSSSSPAVVLCEESLDGRAPSMPTHAYLLEVDVAAEVLEVWSSRRSGLTPSPEEATEALIHFAAHGTHLPLPCHHVGCGRPGGSSCAACGWFLCDRHEVVPGRSGGCRSCSPARVVASPARSAGGAPPLLWAGLQVAGVLGLALGGLTGAGPLLVAGTCLLVVGGCIWLGSLVLRVMG